MIALLLGGFYPKLDRMRLALHIARPPSLPLAWSRVGLRRRPSSTPWTMHAPRLYGPLTQQTLTNTCTFAHTQVTLLTRCIESYAVQAVFTLNFRNQPYHTPLWSPQLTHFWFKDLHHLVRWQPIFGLRVTAFFILYIPYHDMI